MFIDLRRKKDLRKRESKNNSIIIIIALIIKCEYPAENTPKFVMQTLILSLLYKYRCIEKMHSCTFKCNKQS